MNLHLSTTEQDNLRVLQRYNELWREDQLANAAAVIDAQFARHGSSGKLRGIASFQRYVRHYLEAFPDLRFTVIDYFVREEKILMRYLMTGTNRSAFLGIPPSMGTRIRVEGAAIYRFSQARLCELWDYLDLMALAQQLGATSIHVERGRW